jgi:hypothetical protein
MRCVGGDEQRVAVRRGACDIGRAIMPLAPALFSMTMPTPSACDKGCEISRVVVSVPLPAAKGNTRVMLRLG